MEKSAPHPHVSAHSIEFAKQIHKNRGAWSRPPSLAAMRQFTLCTSVFIQGKKNCVRRTRFFFSIRSKAWFRSRGCSKNDSFSTASNRLFRRFLFFAAKDGRMYPSFFCHKMQKTTPKGGLLTDFDCICYNRNGQVHIAVRPSVPFPLSAAGRRWRECGKRHFSFSYVQ